MIITVFTLIIVTFGGDVGHSRGYETLQTCEQAKSLALTGRTIEQNKAMDEAYDKAQADQAARWREANPPRVPTEAERKKWAGQLFSSAPYSTIGKDGLIYDYPGGGMMVVGPGYNPNQGESVVWERGGYTLKHKYDVKNAECVVEPGTR